MPKIRTRQGTTDNKTCRVCLTKSLKFNKDLSLSINDDDEEKSSARNPLIFEVMEEIMGERILKLDEYSGICVICLRHLRIAYYLKQQYKKSKEFLLGCLSTCSQNTYYISNKSSKTKMEDENEKRTPLQNKEASGNKSKSPLKESNFVKKEKDVPSVELVLGEESYDVNSLVIIEENPSEETDKTYKGFLDNLGTVISASFAKKGDSNPQRLETQAELSITPLNEKSFNDELLEPLLFIPSKMSYTCPHCQRSFDSISFMQQHMPLCEKFQNVQCYICNEQKTNLQELILHIRNEHQSAQNVEHPGIDQIENEFRCKDCGKIMMNKKRLKYHMKQHEGKQFRCHICGHGFLFEYKLKNHIAVKHGKRRAVEVCPVCAKTFHYKGGLHSHMKMHTQKFAYSCSYCDKKFIHQASKTVHERNHTGEKPYQCRFCERLFRRYSEWKKHEMSIHTGERPRKCYVCGAGFVQSTNLKVHMLKHDGPFECHFCDKNFVDADILKFHLKRKHMVSDEKDDDVNTHSQNEKNLVTIISNQQLDSNEMAEESDQNEEYFSYY